MVKMLFYDFGGCFDWRAYGTRPGRVRTHYEGQLLKTGGENFSIGTSARKLKTSYFAATAISFSAATPMRCSMVSHDVGSPSLLRFR